MKTITKIVEGRRKICEPSYYRWWQMNNSPSFYNALIKISEECGTKYHVAHNPMTSHEDEYSCTIHGIRVTISKSSASNVCVKTQMRGTTAKHDWIDYQVSEDDLYIPYFKTFLENLRKVWYEQYKYDTGHKP